MLKKLMNPKREMNRIEVCEMNNLRNLWNAMHNSKKRQISLLIIRAGRAKIHAGKYAGK